MTTPCTPEQIQQAVITTTQAAALLGIHETSAYQLLHRRLRPVLIAGRTALWLRSSVLAIAEEGPGRKLKSRPEVEKPY